MGVSVTLITKGVNYIRGCDRAMADFSIALHAHIAQSQADRQEFRAELKDLHRQIRGLGHGSDD